MIEEDFFAVDNLLNDSIRIQESIDKLTKECDRNFSSSSTKFSKVESFLLGKNLLSWVKVCVQQLFSEGRELVSRTTSCNEQHDVVVQRCSVLFQLLLRLQYIEIMDCIALYAMLSSRNKNASLDNSASKSKIEMAISLRKEMLHILEPLVCSCDNNQLTGYSPEDGDKDVDDEDELRPDHFIRGFDEEEDNRNEYKSQAECLIYNEREKLFDALSDLFRAHQSIALSRKKDADKISEIKHFWTVRFPLCSKIFVSIHDENYQWFATFFLKYLLFYGTIPLPLHLSNATASSNVSIHRSTPTNVSSGEKSLVKPVAIFAAAADNSDKASKNFQDVGQVSTPLTKSKNTNNMKSQSSELLRSMFISSNSNNFSGNSNSNSRNGAMINSSKQLLPKSNSLKSNKNVSKKNQSLSKSIVPETIGSDGGNSNTSAMLMGSKSKDISVHSSNISFKDINKIQKLEDRLRGSENSSSSSGAPVSVWGNKSNHITVLSTSVSGSNISTMKGSSIPGSVATSTTSTPAATPPRSSTTQHTHSGANLTYSYDSYRLPSQSFSSSQQFFFWFIVSLDHHRFTARLQEVIGTEISDLVAVGARSSPSLFQSVPQSSIIQAPSDTCTASGRSDSFSMLFTSNSSYGDAAAPAIQTMKGPSDEVFIPVNSGCDIGDPLCRSPSQTHVQHTTSPPRDMSPSASRRTWSMGSEGLLPTPPSRTAVNGTPSNRKAEVPLLTPNAFAEHVVKLKVLGKFLGFLHSFPHWTVYSTSTSTGGMPSMATKVGASTAKQGKKSGQVVGGKGHVIQSPLIAAQLQKATIRRQESTVQCQYPLVKILSRALNDGCLVLVVPWVISFLSMFQWESCASKKFGDEVQGSFGIYSDAVAMLRRIQLDAQFGTICASRSLLHANNSVVGAGEHSGKRNASAAAVKLLSSNRLYIIMEIQSFLFGKSLSTVPKEPIRLDPCEVMVMAPLCRNLDSLNVVNFANGRMIRKLAPLLYDKIVEECTKLHPHQALITDSGDQSTTRSIANSGIDDNASALVESKDKSKSAPAAAFPDLKIAISDGISAGASTSCTSPVKQLRKVVSESVINGTMSEMSGSTVGGNAAKDLVIGSPRLSKEATSPKGLAVNRQLFQDADDCEDSPDWRSYLKPVVDVNTSIDVNCKPNPRLIRSFWSQHPHLKNLFKFIVIDHLPSAGCNHMRELVILAIPTFWADCLSTIHHLFDSGDPACNVIGVEDEPMRDPLWERIILVNEVHKVIEKTMLDGQSFLDKFLKTDVLQLATSLCNLYPCKAAVSELAVQLMLSEAEQHVKPVLLQYLHKICLKKFQEVAQSAVQQQRKKIRSSYTQQAQARKLTISPTGSHVIAGSTNSDLDNKDAKNVTMSAGDTVVSGATVNESQVDCQNETAKQQLLTVKRSQLDAAWIAIWALFEKPMDINVTSLKLLHIKMIPAIQRELPDSSDNQNSLPGRSLLEKHIISYRNYISRLCRDLNELVACMAQFCSAKTACSVEGDDVLLLQEIHTFSAVLFSAGRELSALYHVVNSEDVCPAQFGGNNKLLGRIDIQMISIECCKMFSVSLLHLIELEYIYQHVTSVVSGGKKFSDEMLTRAGGGLIPPAVGVLDLPDDFHEVSPLGSFTLFLQLNILSLDQYIRVISTTMLKSNVVKYYRTVRGILLWHLVSPKKPTIWGVMLCHIESWLEQQKGIIFTMSDDTAVRGESVRIRGWLKNDEHRLLLVSTTSTEFVDLMDQLMAMPGK